MEILLFPNYIVKYYYYNIINIDDWTRSYIHSYHKKSIKRKASIFYRVSEKKDKGSGISATKKLLTNNFYTLCWL